MDDQRATVHWPFVPDRRARLEEFCEAYGCEPDMIIRWHLDRPTEPGWLNRAHAGEEPWATYYRHRLHERAARDREWLSSWWQR